jgi:PhnB protein
MPVKAVPDGYPSVTTYLIVRGAAQAIDYYKSAFDGVELMRLDAPGGLIGHAEVRIGNTPVMLADENPEWGVKAPQSLGGSPVQLLLYVDDCDAVFQRAIAAGGTEVRPMRDQFYGDRAGTLTDPFGHQWTIASRKEDLTVEEIKRRAEEAARAASGASSASGASGASGG